LYRLRYSNIFKPYPYVDVETLHNYNRGLDFKKGIVLIKRIFENHYAKQIQKVWKHYWYNSYYDSNYGYYVSRFMISKQKYLC